MYSSWQKARRRGLPADGCLLVADVARQRLELWRGARIRARYRISTSRLGLGNKTGSYRTPPGWHRVVRWIGSACALGTVFKARRATSRKVPPSDWQGGTRADLILSRILRLRGLEPGVNAGRGIDSYDRFIYIHGTNQEHRLGQPASHGCIRMGNRDVAALFRRTRGRVTWCWIRP